MVVRRSRVAELAPLSGASLLPCRHSSLPTGTTSASPSRGPRQRWTGLLFVAVSINLKQILKVAYLPTRAAEPLSIMIGLLLLSVFLLVPGQRTAVLGAEAPFLADCSNGGPHPRA